jgi:hypothetical protein
MKDNSYGSKGFEILGLFIEISFLLLNVEVPNVTAY